MVLGHWLVGSGPPPFAVGAADNVYPDMGERYNELVVAGADLLGVPSDGASRLVNLDMDFLGAGYGIVTPESLETIALLARTEGILTDPIYTGKALAALVHAARRGDVRESVVFWRTGGSPGVFEPEYASALWRHSRGDATAAHGEPNVASRHWHDEIARNSHLRLLPVRQSRVRR